MATRTLRAALSSCRSWLARFAPRRQATVVRALHVSRGPREDAAMLELRWMIRADLPQVFAIEREAYGRNAWSADDLQALPFSKNVIGMTAELGGRVVGYSIRRFDGFLGHYELLNVTVAREYRRRRIGTAMIRRLQRKLGRGRRDEMRVLVPESNLGAQLFFRSVGFVGTCHSQRRAIHFRYVVPRDTGGLVLQELLHGDGRTLPEHEVMSF